MRHPEERKVSTRLLIGLRENLAGEEGFEPSLPDSESGVLPLNYSPATLRKAGGIGQKIQSLLPNPLTIVPPSTKIGNTDISSLFHFHLPYPQEVKRAN